MFEAAKTTAWKDDGAKGVIDAIPKRLREEGWNSVRPALAVTVRYEWNLTCSYYRHMPIILNRVSRAWILRAFMENGLRSNAGAALEFYTSALEVLQWGSHEWADVPYDQKGSIFQPTFIRGVKCLRLDLFMKVSPSPSNPSVAH